MGTPLQKIYDRFLNKINDPDLISLDADVLEYDLRGLLDSSLPYFLCPKVSLEIDDDTESFPETLNNDETNLLAVMMCREWCHRFLQDTNATVQKWAESDFEFKSQASHLNALVNAKRNSYDKQVETLLSNYSRKGEGTMFDYGQLVGK